MQIINTITYTSQGREYKARLVRDYKLTYRGAERILRRIDNDAIVVRIETAAEA